MHSDGFHGSVSPQLHCDSAVSPRHSGVDGQPQRATDEYTRTQETTRFTHGGHNVVAPYVAYYDIETTVNTDASVRAT